ncbi:MAG: glycosyltransferase involved in cell wall biosynthesis [Pseudohongiellaceae bacterium]|jgi:glycosyltransferase involved in cell wall biosynthesis
MKVEHATAPAVMAAKTVPLAIVDPAACQQRPLKICLLGYRSAPYSGGQGIYIKYLSKALVEAGHQVDVISGQPYPLLDARVRLIKMPGMNLFETGLRSLRPHHLTSLTNIIEWTGKLTGAFSEPHCFGRRVYKYLKKQGRHYDIIHDNQSLSWSMLKLQRNNFSLVTTIHHPITSDLNIALNDADTRTERFFIRRWHSFLKMQAKVTQQLNHVVTVSERSQQDIAVAFGIQPVGISLVYNGIDTDEFQPLPNVARVPFRIMATTSADSPLKGLSYLLHAVAELVQHYPNLELLLVGKPRAGGETEQLIEQLGIANHIRFVSGISTEQLVQFYAEAQVAVVPSVYEGFGLPAGEAMACGVPVVSTNGGALPEVVGDAGIQVPVKDSESLARAISDLLDDGERRQQLGLAGRQRIEQLFCWTRAANQMTNYYYRVLAGQDDA